LICSACHTVYAPSERELGKVDSLAGLCERCGSKPHFLPFAIAYVEGAFAALVTIEFIMLVFMSVTPRAALVLAGIIAFAAAAIYIFARQSLVVRYTTDRERRSATWLHRLLGMAFGIATTLAAFIVIQTTGL
jgi:hypothetical protein